MRVLLGTPRFMASRHPVCNGQFRSRGHVVSPSLCCCLRWSPVASQNLHLKESCSKSRGPAYLTLLLALATISTRVPSGRTAWSAASVTARARSSSPLGGPLLIGLEQQGQGALARLSVPCPLSTYISSSSCSPLSSREQSPQWQGQRSLGVKG